MSSPRDEPHQRAVHRTIERQSRGPSSSSPVRPARIRAVIVLAGAVCTLAIIGEVAATTEHTTLALARATDDGENRLLQYPFEQVWPTAIRFLRLDRGYQIAEQDKEAGYVIFDFGLDGDRVGRGQLEFLVVTDPAGRPSVRAMLSTTAGPAHLPYTILDGLATKLRAERGQPAPPPPRDKPGKQPPPDKNEDAGTD